MTLLITCLFIATLFPYLAKIPVAYAMQQAGGYNNNYPREQQAALQGFGARALAAHQNSFESLLVFAIAILTAIATNNNSNLVETLAVVHIIARVFYHVLYLMNLAMIRSLVWSIGLLSSLVILGSCMV
ncbi:MAG: MAPEG family protein [Legionella sp.]|nr:MAPEG family protein [Legionella sp.]